MSALTVEAPTGVAPAVRGSVHVRERVLEKVVREASAVTIGVPRGDVDVEVSEWGGGLAVRVTARLPIPDLDDTEAIRAAPTVIERLRQMQSVLGAELGRLTGREMRRVSFTVTGATVPERRRVR
ncbi:NTP pyrophosphohydrolase [Microbacterium sp. YY-01]|uniref:NTP pyrophosphohydrolase n=1 Tax=Microbacterium sp. YY-01 TaxID=3421634 RepID=UPI003D181451